MLNIKYQAKTEARSLKKKVDQSKGKIWFRRLTRRFIVLCPACLQSLNQTPHSSVDSPLHCALSGMFIVFELDAPLFSCCSTILFPKSLRAVGRVVAQFVGLSPRRRDLDLRPVRMAFAVNKLSLGQVVLLVHQFPVAIILPSMPHSPILIIYHAVDNVQANSGGKLEI